MGNETKDACSQSAVQVSLETVNLDLKIMSLKGAGDSNDEESERRVDFTQVLPSETVEEIFQYLEPKDLASCSAVSTAWREAVNSNKVWGYLCGRKGWKDDFDPNFSHFVKAHKQFRKWTHSYDCFSPLCQKRLLYNKHVALQKNWRCGKYISHKISNGYLENLQLHEPVTCDGRYLVMVERTTKTKTWTTLAMWSLDGIPFKLCDLPLPNSVDSVTAIAFDHGTIAVAQGWMVFVYQLVNSNHFELVFQKDLKKYQPLAQLPRTIKTFSPHLKVCEDFVICVPNNSHSTVDFIPIFFWDRLTGELQHQLSFDSMYFTINNAVWFGDSCFLGISNKKKKSYHMVEFSLKNATWTSFNEKVPVEIEQVVISKEYAVAVTKSTNPTIRHFFNSRFEHNNKTVWIWDRATGSSLKSLDVQGRSFQFIDGYLMFFHSSKVTVMNPRNPDVTSEFEVMGTISCIRAAPHPSILVIIKTGCYIEVWDWGLGSRLYTVTSDSIFGSQVWCDDKRIITYHPADSSISGGILVLGFW